MRSGERKAGPTVANDKQQTRGVTISFARCEVHPLLRTWPAKNLIQSSCPRCTHAVDPSKTERELKARRLIADRGAVR